MEIKIVNFPYQGEETKPENIQFSGESWTCDARMYQTCLSNRGPVDILKPWIEYLNKKNPDVVYLHKINVYFDKNINIKDYDGVTKIMDGVSTFIWFDMKKTVNVTKCE